jgi:hypothetical protein
VGRSFWEGAKIVYNRGLSNTFQVAHTFTLTPEGNERNNYTFAPVYIGTRPSKDGKVCVCVCVCVCGVHAFIVFVALQVTPTRHKPHSPRAPSCHCNRLLTATLLCAACRVLRSSQ